MFWDLIWNLSRYYICKHSYHFHFLFWEFFLILLNLFCLCLLLNAFCVVAFLYSKYSNGKLWNRVPVVLSFSFHVSLKGESHIMMMMSVVMCFTLCVPPLCQYRKSSTPFFLLNECHTIVISITVKESSALKYGRGWSFKWLPLVQYKNDKKGQQRANQRLFHPFFFMGEQLWLAAKLILVLYMGKGVQLKRLPYMTMTLSPYPKILSHALVLPSLTDCP